MKIKRKALPAKPPKDWHANYPKAHYQVIHRENLPRAELSALHSSLIIMLLLTKC